jgi:hypothetical protein
LLLLRPGKLASQESAPTLYVPYRPEALHAGVSAGSFNRIVVVSQGMIVQPITVVIS